MKKHHFNIGTSGWSFSGWLGNFYPDKIKSSLALPYYANILDHRQYRSPEIVTGSFIYVRMHGPNEEAYKGAYEETTLITYAEKFIQWQKEGKAIYCYFDNDEKANAPKDAQRLKHLLNARLE